MTAQDLGKKFIAIKKGRRKDPAASLRALGDLATVALGTLVADCSPSTINTVRIPGKKTYKVFHPRDNPGLFSRPINAALFVADPTDFRQRWRDALEVMLSDAGTGRTSLPAATVNQLFYTAVMSYAAVTDVSTSGNRGSPGTLLEIAVGSAISLLSGHPVMGGVALKVDGYASPIDVTVDMTFGSADELPATTTKGALDEYELTDESDETADTPVMVDESAPPDDLHTSRAGVDRSNLVLVVPTKLSTRERIVQAFAHQRILDKAKPGKYHTVLCACNENNLTKPAKSLKDLANIGVTDTLVANTIVLYQLHVAKLAGIYYLDPPPSYLVAKANFPHVATFGELLAMDLPTYLPPAPAKVE